MAHNTKEINMTIEENKGIIVLRKKLPETGHSSTN